MRNNASVCLRFDLEPIASQIAEKLLYGAYLEEVLKAAGKAEERVQFCVSAESIPQHADFLRRAAREGHGVDGLIPADHPVLLGREAALEQRLANMEAAFTQACLSWWGVSAAGPDQFHLPGKSEVLQQFADLGCRWLAFQSPPFSAYQPAQPAMLAPDLYGIPSDGHLAQLFSAAYPVKEPDGLETPKNWDREEIREQFFRHFSHQIETAAAAGLFYTLALPVDLLVLIDPQGALPGRLLALAQALSLPPITLNEIADVSLANDQAGPKAKARVSVQQHLHFRRYWDTSIGPSQQAYKVYDYRGGWRLKPGFYHFGTSGWEMLSEPDAEHGYQINRHGLRGALFPHRKPQGEKRLVISGDSCVFGVAGDLRPWPAQLQLRLDELAGRGEIRVLNAGIEGQSSVHCLMRLKRLLTFEPDALLVAVAANDLFIENPAEYVDTTGLQYATSWEVVGEYPRERDITKTIGGVRRPMTLENFYPYSYAYHLREIVRECREHSVVPILMTLPCLFPADLRLAGEAHRQKMHTPTFVAPSDLQTMRRLYEIYNHTVQQVAADEGVHLIDGEGFFAGTFDNQRHVFFSDTCHPTAEGNVFLGRYIADQLWPILSGELRR